MLRAEGTVVDGLLEGWWVHWWLNGVKRAEGGTQDEILVSHYGFLRFLKILLEHQAAGSARILANKPVLQNAFGGNL